MHLLNRAFKLDRSLVAGAAALFLLAIAAGCTGFFVNQPNSITVTQSGANTLAVVVGTPQQLTATGSFDSGTKDVTRSATWTSSTACATVSSTGLVTGVGNNSNVTITATVAGVSGSISGAITGGNSQSLTITSTPPGTTFSSGTTANFFASLNGNDVTNSTTWTSSDSSVATFSSNVATFVGQGTATITGSFAVSGSCATGSETVTVQ